MMMHKWLLSLLLVCGSAFSQQYNLALNQYPPCDTSWQVSGNTYTCSGDGKITLNSGDTVIASAESTLVANNGFELRGNTIGTTSNQIHLQAQYGQIETLTTQTTTLYGNITANSSNVTLSNIALYGNITTGGNITLNTGVVQGNFTSSNNSVSVTNVQLTGNITANSSVTMTGGTYSGNITLLANNPVTFNSVTMTSGSVSGASHFNATNSQIGSPDNPVTIATTSNDITLTNTTVYGDLTAATNNAGGVVHVDGNSSVIGSCLPVSSPTNACAPAPVALYRFDETQWTGQVGEVKNTFSTSLYGRARNGATTNNIDPALSPDMSNMGTCGYGEFVASQNQYVNVPHDPQLSFTDQLTVSAWVYPNDYPNSGLMSIVSKDGNYEFHLDSSGRVYWYWEIQGGGYDVLTSTKSIPKNQWSHITVRYNKSGAPQRQSIFINGQLDSSSNRNDTLAINDRPLQIGQDQNFAGRAFDGRIDEVAIYSRALSDSQILDLYNQRHQCSGPTLQCFSDSFDSSLSDLWVTSTSKGTFQPGVVNGRLRFTQAVGNQSTSSSYQRLFPARDNLVEVEFDHFAYDGTGADGIAVVLSDARVTPRAGAFGGPLGYGFKPNEPGFAGGWLGIGIDEYGNFSNEGGEGAMPGRRRQSVALRGSGEDETGYRYLAGACNNGTTNTSGSCLSPTVDNNNSGDVHRYKIVVDSRVSNQSQVEILRKVGSGNWQTIVGPLNVLDSQYNQAAVPDDFLLSITGSTGGSNNIHEIDNFQVCALDSSPIDQQIDHFRIIHTGQGVTCSAESVTILACNNADCSELFTDPVQATLSPATVSGGGGWVGGNVINFSGGSTTVEIRKNQPGSITLGVSGSSPTTKPFATTLCQTGGGWSASHCSTTFADSGFVIDVPDFIANSSATATIKAVKTSDASLQCVPEFANVDKTINFWSSYIAPDSSSVVGSPAVSINTEEIGKSQALASAIPMTFNASGEASFTLNYPDAGKMQLNARYQGSGTEDGLLMVGSDQFVSFPKYLQISASNSQSDNGQCTTANTSCEVFAAAGEPFDLLVTAYGEGDVVTPNYQHGNMALTHALVAPALGQAGTLSTASYQQVPIVGGTNTVEQSVSEVGVFNFTVTPQGAFQGSNAYTIAAASTGNIGRFIPAYFAVSPMTVALEAACSAGAQPFTYLGQSFGYASNSPLGLYLQPKSGSGSDTLNYLIGDWWRYNNTWERREYINNRNGLLIEKLNSDTEVIRQSPSTSGVILINEQLRYQKPANPIIPFNTDFSLRLFAEDLLDEGGALIKKADLKDEDGVCYRASYSTECLDYTFNNIDQAMPLYWGRVVVEDVAGFENQQLKQKIASEYYTTSGFVTNTHDGCTQLPALTPSSFSSDNFSVNQAGLLPTVVVTYENQTNGPLLLDKGLSALDYSAPGLGNRGVIKALLDLETHGLPWLRTYHQQSLSWQKSAVGLAQFGFYSGSNRVIWWRESN
ncbi:DUF6701 domain-containing protein [Vibrio navarrensis]|uniref:DUF6701 domain-containing protein n=1 Tax=Vibrio navarrensis TaxID=29495 RepID=UPI0018DD8058|nr:DUF6701 domain-containing protein [Vibrio navarrensis]MBH9740944.1 MSHA biogenesis protein MshQ [Vibrio navarrensis]